MQGTKEIVEMLEGVKLLGVTVKAVMKDGKISIDDLGAVMSLLTKVNVMVAAVDGAGAIPAEVKDLSGEEIQAVVAKALEVAAAIKAA